MGVGRQGVSGVSVVLLALAVSACTGPSMGSQPSGVTPTSVPARPSSTSSTVTPSASTSSPAAATRPAIPAAARAHTAAGAEAFARFYIDTVNRSWNLADPLLLDGLALSSCKTCLNFRRTAENLNREQLHYESSAISLGLSLPLPESRMNLATIQFIYVQLSRLIVNDAGRIVRKVPRKSALTQFDIAWSQRGWKIQEIRVVRPS